MIFSGPADATFSVLRDYLNANINRPLTSGSIRTAIEKDGRLTIKDAKLDPTVPEQVRRATSDYLSTYIPFGFGGDVVARSEADNITSQILDEAGAGLILVTGPAGAGKSGVIRQVLDRLQLKEVPCLAFRVDRLLEAAPDEDFPIAGDRFPANSGSRD